MRESWDGVKSETPMAWVVRSEGGMDMANDKTALTDVIIHTVVREAYRGRSVDEAFEIAGVAPAVGREWLREGGRYEERQQRYVLKEALDSVLHPDNRANQETYGRMFPSDAFWVRRWIRSLMRS